VTRLEAAMAARGRRTSAPGTTVGSGDSCPAVRERHRRAISPSPETIDAVPASGNRAERDSAVCTEQRGHVSAADHTVPAITQLKEAAGGGGNVPAVSSERRGVEGHAGNSGAGCYDNRVAGRPLRRSRTLAAGIKPGRRSLETLALNHQEVKASAWERPPSRRSRKLP
jgi:hypothetical protein